MASSGSTSVAATKYDTLTFNWSVSSQDTASNYSVVSWNLQLVAGSSGRISSSVNKTYTIVVNGTTYSGSNNVGISSNSTKTLASGNTTVYHNSDGTGSFSYSFTQQFAITFSGNYIGSISGSGSGVLNTIARASSITSASDVTLGGSSSIVWTPASSSFSYVISITCGGLTNQTSVISPGSTSAYTYAFGMSVGGWAPYITSATSATATVTLTTYSGSTVIGTSSKLITVYVPSSVVPTVSISVSQVNTYISGKWLVKYSQPKVTITKSGIYGSTISSVRTVFNGESSTSASTATFQAANSSGTYTIKTTVTDSRGRIATASASVTYVAYSIPNITITSLYRASDTSGTANATTGAYGYLKWGYNVSSVSNLNTFSVLVQYKAKTATSYSTLASYTSTYVRTGLTNSFSANTGVGYDVVFTIKDKVTTITHTLTLPTAFALMHFVKDGTGMAIGKVGTLSDKLEVGMGIVVDAGDKVSNREGDIVVSASDHIASVVAISADNERGAALGANSDGTRGIFDVYGNIGNGMFYKDSSHNLHVGDNTVGSVRKPIYLNGGIPTAISGTVGSANIPVYLNGGTITSTGKSFANYLPLSGGEITGYLRTSSWIQSKSGIITSGASGATSECVVRAQAAAGHIYLYAAGSSSGNRGIYTYSASGAGISVATVNSSNTVTHYGSISSVSDERLKKDWREIDIYDGFFDSLQPKSFKYISDPKAYHLGFGAQAVKQSLTDNGLTEEDFAGFGECGVEAPKDEDPYLALDYQEFVPLLVYEVQQLKSQVKELKEELESLRKVVEAKE